GAWRTTPTAAPTSGCRRSLRGAARPATPHRSPPHRGRSRRRELTALGGDPVEELGERVDELLDAFALERVGDVVVVDAGRRDLLEHLIRLVDPVLERERDLAVVLERLDRLLRHRVHGPRADQL